MVKKLGTVMILVALTGCGGDAIKELIPHASCTNAALATCQDFSGAVGSARTEFQNACTTAGGTNGSADCATANRAGSCTLALAPGVSTVTRYYTPTWNATTAQTACTAAGTAAGVTPTFTPN